jgi:hypothetical protein
MKPSPARKPLSKKTRFEVFKRELAKTERNWTNFHNQASEIVYGVA